jgi:hypothetical protein
MADHFFNEDRLRRSGRLPLFMKSFTKFIKGLGMMQRGQ